MWCKSFHPLLVLPIDRMCPYSNHHQYLVFHYLNLVHFYRHHLVKKRYFETWLHYSLLPNRVSLPNTVLPIYLNIENRSRTLLYINIPYFALKSPKITTFVPLFSVPGWVGEFLLFVLGFGGPTKGMTIIWGHFGILDECTVGLSYLSGKSC